MNHELRAPSTRHCRVRTLVIAMLAASCTLVALAAAPADAASPSGTLPKKCKTYSAIVKLCIWFTWSTYLGSETQFAAHSTFTNVNGSHNKSLPEMEILAEPKLAPQLGYTEIANNLPLQPAGTGNLTDKTPTFNCSSSRNYKALVKYRYFAPAPDRKWLAGTLSTPGYTFNTVGVHGCI